MGPAQTVCRKCGNLFSVKKSQSPVICNACFERQNIEPPEDATHYEYDADWTSPLFYKQTWRTAYMYTPDDGKWVTIGGLPANAKSIFEFDKQAFKPGPIMAIGDGEIDVYEFVKPNRYIDTKGRDLIDDWSDRKTPDEVRAALLFNIEKYSRRYGKKDDNVSEAKKIADYAQRLLNFERQLLSDNS